MTAVPIAMRIFSVIGVCGLFFLLLSVQGCPPAPRPSGVRYPITSGSHTILPKPEQRILMWADAPVADLAVQWLRVHHYSVIVMPVEGLFRTSPIQHDFATRNAALAVAREMKAAIVLFVEREVTNEGALIESDCGPLFNVSVDVRGLSVQDEEQVLRGSAHYPHCIDVNEKTLRSLTCQAFATAWGFRPAGQLEIPSSLMCTTGQTAPSPIR
jgi:hypothetical protein